jgi:hypothetical protein
MDMEYRYTTGQNNGRITQSKDWISGEEVTYAYDSLQRLISAQAKEPRQSWSGAFTWPDSWQPLFSVELSTCPASGEQWRLPAERHRSMTVAALFPEWGNAFSYDGFGNLTAKTVTKGSAPSLAQAYHPATNRPVG